MKNLAKLFATAFLLLIVVWNAIGKTMVKDIDPCRDGTTLGSIDDLYFRIDYKILFHFDDCQHCQFKPCTFCFSPCLTCPAPLEQFGYAYEVTFSYENPLEEKILLPVGKQNFFQGIQQEKIGQTEIFEHGYHENVFSVIAAPGQQVAWTLIDVQGNKRTIAYTLPAALTIKAYPNPNEDLFTLSVNGSNENPQEAYLSINDENGVLIGEKKITIPYKNTIDLRAYTKGLYLLKVSIGNQYIAEKVKIE